MKNIYCECYQLKYKPEYLDMIKYFYRTPTEPGDWGAPCGCELLCDGDWEDLYYAKYIWCCKMYDPNNEEWTIRCDWANEYIDNEAFEDVIELKTLDEWFDKIIELGAEIDKQIKDEDETIITEDILVDNGFEFMEHETELLLKYQKDNYGIDHYVMYRIWTEDEHPIKIDIDNGWNNRGTKWSVHIDNDACETIGYVDIDYKWQFNKLMEILDSKLRL